ncbi:hypothetical protein PSTG_08855 [Puccinia striiformis f. sp. tritici PST-78]|uniref:Uncharacterized protein n=1 Tax=Puccinia striiformis f. sp. tritici PST-78 TaxID=1165861 RepID=A0A0L0VFQ1_9BASI|nr:hypothetical protein PSTG_08855 [Puccinia striiformis f. sp. tritici PST-78]
MSQVANGSGSGPKTVPETDPTLQSGRFGLGQYVRKAAQTQPEHLAGRVRGTSNHNSLLPHTNNKLYDYLDVIIIDVIPILLLIRPLEARLGGNPVLPAHYSLESIGLHPASEIAQHPATG